MTSDGSNLHAAALVQGLIEKHQDRIRHFIRVRSGHKVLLRTTLEDLYQDTVATALQSTAGFTFHDDGRFLGWICTIARRVIARSLRGPRAELATIRLKGRGSTGVGVRESQIDGQVRTPSSIAAGDEHVSALEMAIDALPKDYRRVLTLYKLEEHALADVARRMNRTEAATSKLIARAISVLRERLAQK